MFTMTMPEHYWDVLTSALCAAEEFYKLDFANGFERVFSNAFAEDNTVSCAEKHSYEILNTLFPVGLENVVISNEHVALINKAKSAFEKKNGEYELTDDELSNVSIYLDLIIRIWLGQWGELQKIVSVCKYKDGSHVNDYFFMDTDDEVAVIKHRHQMIPMFAEHRILSANASFGIYSQVLHDDIRILYGIYKAIRFALYGSSRDIEIVKNSDEPIVIKFPYVDEVTIVDHEQVTEWLDKYPMPDFMGPKKSYVIDGGKLYVYINDYVSIEVVPGTKIYVNKNGRLEVERDGKLYNYRHKVTF